MQTFYVTCPWCKSQFFKPVISNCTNCGGPLPIAHGGGPGDPPPPAPRALSKSYVRSVKYFNNVYTMIGIIFTIPFFWSVIFPIIGIFMWRKGIRDANGELIPLEQGAHTQGEIVSLETDFSKKINGKSPKVMQFLFTANGQQHIGSVPNIMDPIEHWKKPGDKIWVVYMHHDPSMSSVWPPIK